jgi:hypothetical protein
MKYLLATIAIVLLLAVATAALTYRMAGNRDVKAAMAKGDAMEWLRVEFNLDATQYAKIKQLHEAYSTVCEEHCRAIQVANREWNQLRADGSIEPAVLAAAEQKVQALRLECETAIAAHVRHCASLMSPADGARYLALVLPKIRDFDHRSAPDVQLSAHQH